MKTFRTLLILATTLTTWMTPPARGQAGGGGCNGGGIAEMRFQLAFDHAFKLFRYCANLGRCNLTEEEMRWTRAMLAAEKTERKALGNFHFESGRPQDFFIDGAPRIARTGNAPGDTIFGNLDLMYRKNALGETEALTYLEAVVAVVHELAHHVGGKDHTALDAFGAKIAAVAKRFGFSGSLGFGAEYIRFLVMNSRDDSMQVQVTPNPEQSLGALSIEDAEEAYDVTKLVMDPIVNKRGLCLDYADESRTSCRVPLGPEHVIQSVQFYNLHWGDFSSTPLFRKEPTTIALTGTAALFGWTKETGDLGLVGAYIEFTIEFQVREKAANLLTILEKTIRLRSISVRKGGVTRLGETPIDVERAQRQ